MSLVLAPDFMTRCTDLNTRMREIVVDWLFEVAENWEMNEYTIHLAIYILDAYISITSSLDRKDYQKAAVVSLYISSKIEERYNPTMSDIAFICDKTYTTDELLEMERTILETLKYDVLYDTFIICRDRICHHDSEAKSNFYMDCVLFNPTLMYKHDIYDIVESCHAIAKKDDKYWSQSMNEIEKFIKTFTTDHEKCKHVKRYRRITNL